MAVIDIIAVWLIQEGDKQSMLWTFDRVMVLPALQLPDPSGKPDEP